MNTKIVPIFVLILLFILPSYVFASGSLLALLFVFSPFLIWFPVALIIVAFLFVRILAKLGVTSIWSRVIGPALAYLIFYITIQFIELPFFNSSEVDEFLGMIFSYLLLIFIVSVVLSLFNRALLYKIKFNKFQWFNFNWIVFFLLIFMHASIILPSVFNLVAYSSGRCGLLVRDSTEAACWSKLAIENINVEICQKITATKEIRQKSLCILNIARANQDIALCKQLPESEYKNNDYSFCLLDIDDKSNFSESMCLGIKNQKLSKDCLIGRAASLNKPNLCNGFELEDTRIKCFQELAVKNNNVDYCYLIDPKIQHEKRVGDYRQDSCFIELARVTRQPDVCRYVTHESKPGVKNLRQWCVSSAR